MTWKAEIKEALDQLIDTKEANKIAVFDADGTLWHGDLGEAFFKYQIENKLAPGLKGISDPWNYYREMADKDAAGSCGWLAQINAGLSDEELLEQGKSFYEKEYHAKLNSNLRELIEKLKSKNFQIWVCTASIKWAIAPALIDLGLAPGFLIAAEVELDQKKKLTKKIIDPIPYRPGKKFWLEQKLQDKPLLVVGNSMGDLEMMGLATILSLAVIFEPQLPEIKDSQEGMILEATKRGWPIQIFR